MWQKVDLSGYWATRPGWLAPIMNFIVLEPSHWIMQTPQFTNLRRRVEGTVEGVAAGLPASAPATGSAVAPPAATR